MEYSNLSNEQLQVEYDTLALALIAAWGADEKWAIREQRQAVRDVAKARGVRLV
jgi:hypothetical protein